MIAFKKRKMLLCNDINFKEDDNDDDIIANDEDTIDELKQIHND